MNLPGSSANAGSDRIASSNSVTSPRTSALPPTRPDNGDATMLRTRSWVREGNSPAAATMSATAAVSVMARSWTLARDVSSMAGEANRVAASASAANCPAEIMPPGNRTRARAPSAAWCNCSAPGQASRSRVLATCSPYGPPR